MEFFKNFYKEDDKIIGLCAFRKKKTSVYDTLFGRKCETSEFIFDTKMRANMFLY